MLLKHKIYLKRQCMHGICSFSLVLAKVNRCKPDERSKCSTVWPVYCRHSTYQNVLSDQICPHASQKSATSKVRFYRFSQLESSWDKSPNCWSSDDSAARRREIILDQICRVLPPGKAKSRGEAVTEINQEWFSRGARQANFVILGGDVRGWIGLAVLVHYSQWIPAAGTRMDLSYHSHDDG